MAPAGPVLKAIVLKVIALRAAMATGPVPQASARLGAYGERAARPAGDRPAGGYGERGPAP